MNPLVTNMATRAGDGAVAVCVRARRGEASTPPWPARSDGRARDLTSYAFLYAYVPDSGPLYVTSVENGMDGENKIIMADL
jgi:hypothetical protein